jgi:hypothetical protein
MAAQRGSFLQADRRRFPQRCGASDPGPHWQCEWLPRPSEPQRAQRVSGALQGLPPIGLSRCLRLSPVRITDSDSDVDVSTGTRLSCSYTRFSTRLHRPFVIAWHVQQGRWDDMRVHSSSGCDGAEMHAVAASDPAASCDAETAIWQQESVKLKQRAAPDPLRPYGPLLEQPPGGPHKPRRSWSLQGLRSRELLGSITRDVR